MINIEKPFEQVLKIKDRNFSRKFNLFFLVAPFQNTGIDFANLTKFQYFSLICSYKIFTEFLTFQIFAPESLNEHVFCNVRLTVADIFNRPQDLYVHSCLKRLKQLI